MYKSSSDTVLAEQTGATLRIRLNRPEKLNAWNYEMITAMKKLVQEVKNDWAIRAVTFEGAGPAFCAGEDMEDMGDWPQEYRHRRPGGSHGAAPVPQQELLRLIRRMSQPTIAVMHGRVLGIGLDLACACDIRLCADDTVIGDPRIHQARFAATGITYVLPRLIGQSQAMRLLLLGEEIDGKEAERIALVYRSFPAGELYQQAEELLAQVVTMATRSYAIIKQQILDELDMPYDTALMHSLAIRQTNIIEDQQEGIAAFREKRQPRFKGR